MTIRATLPSYCDRIGLGYAHSGLGDGLLLLECLAMRRGWALGIVAAPVGAGLAVLGWGIAHDPEIPADAAAPAVTITATVTAASPVTSTPITNAPTAAVPAVDPPTVTVTESAAPVPPPAEKTPQGELALDEWHDTAGSPTCATVQTFYDNRSDTAVDKVTQAFQTTYTPKHADGQYPDAVNGPLKKVTQTVGVAPYTRKQIMWQVCAPELKDKQNPPRPDGLDSFMSEIGAQPTSYEWTWTR